MLTVFWSPVHGQVATTSNMLAISSLMALDYNQLILLTHTHFERSTVEKAFSRLRKSGHGATLDVGGIDEIERLSYCGMLTPEKVRECTESFIENRLDVLAGSSDDQRSFLEALPQILEASRKYYKMTFIDVSSGNRNEVSRIVLENADLVVINLNQNLSVLESFNNGQDVPDFLQHKKVVYCIGNFHYQSNMSVNRIAKILNVNKKQIFTVPFNFGYMDDLNNGDIPACFIRMKNVKKKRFEFNEAVQFIDAVRSAGKTILRELSLYPQEVMPE